MKYKNLEKLLEELLNSGIVKNKEELFIIIDKCRDEIRDIFNSKGGDDND